MGNHHSRQRHQRLTAQWSRLWRPCCRTQTQAALSIGGGRTVPEYEIRVSVLVPQDVLVEIEGMRVVVEPVHTVLRGVVPDQAALHGIISRLQRVGFDLVEVRRLPGGFGVQDCQIPVS